MVSLEEQEMTIQKRPSRALDGIRRDDLQAQTEGSEEKLEICLMRKKVNSLQTQKKLMKRAWCLPKDRNRSS